MRETEEGGSRGEESGHRQPEDKANNSGEKEKKPEVAAERRQGEEGEVRVVDAVLAWSMRTCHRGEGAKLDLQTPGKSVLQRCEGFRG